MLAELTSDDVVGYTGKHECAGFVVHFLHFIFTDDLSDDEQSCVSSTASIPVAVYNHCPLELSDAVVPEAALHDCDCIAV